MPDTSKNLILARSSPSVWDRQDAASGPYDRERWLTTICGASLAVAGARRGGFLGGLVATLGTTIGLRAAMGRHDLGVARYRIDTLLHDRGWRVRARDVVADASDESFPASDAPGWTPTAGAKTRH